MDKPMPGLGEKLIASDSRKKDSCRQYSRVTNCDFDCFVKDPHTPRLAKAIYLDEAWSLNQDDEALALLDSLMAKEKAARPFYFKVVTKSYQKADGYYSEGLGLAAYEFLRWHTKEFVAYFDDTACHTAQDLADWADMVVLELSISREGEYDQPVVEEFLKEANCRNCTPNQKETWNRFGLLLQEKWNAFSTAGK
ncbi:MAG TPA: hypothetical protein VL092_06650 [Chitinophagaceae bacterium]|nr:hypothetical protein [Chitinophagaceae bacterium]